MKIFWTPSFPLRDHLTYWMAPIYTIHKIFSHYVRTKHYYIAPLIIIIVASLGFSPIMFLRSSDEFLFFGTISPRFFNDDKDLLYTFVSYYDIGNYIDYIFMLIAACLDILTFIKLKKFLASQKTAQSKMRLARDALFLFQSFLNVTVFTISIIPGVLFSIMCQGIAFQCYPTIFGQIITILYTYSLRRVLWRTGDEIVAFLIQIWSYERLKISMNVFKKGSPVTMVKGLSEKSGK